MTRKYDQALLQKLQERITETSYKGAKVKIKLLPDSDEIGAMDARLYADQKKQMTMMGLLPKSMLKFDTSEKGILKLREMFNGVKSVSVVEKKINITKTTVKASDGYDIPVRIYKTEEVKDNSPVLLYIHGGGFFGGSPDVVEESVKLLVANTNIVCVSVDYRLAPECPYPLGHNDCYDTLKWIYTNPSTLNIDPKNIFVAGDSAGGNLSQYCSTKCIEDGINMVKAQLLLYPTLNMCGVNDEYFKFSLDEYEMTKKQRKGLSKMMGMMNGMSGGLKDLLGTNDVTNDYLNPYTRDPKGNPPTFISVGEHDSLKVESLAYAAKLTAANVEVETIVYKGMGHAYFDNTGVYPQCEDVIIEMGKYILAHVN